MLTRYASSSAPSMGWCKHLGVGSFDSVIKAYGFIQTFGEACIYKKVSGSSIAFQILYVDDILLIGNDVEFSGKHKGEFKGVCQRKNYL